MSPRALAIAPLFAALALSTTEAVAQLDLNARDQLRYVGEVRAALASEARPCGCPAGYWRTTIRFAIDRHGRLVEAGFVKRSGADAADAAALGIVQRAAAHFPKRPKSAGSQPIRFILPVAFQDGKPVTQQAPGFRP